MRQGFSPQRRLDTSGVLGVELNLDCRDEIIPLLRALQHIYSRPGLRNELLDLVARDVNENARSDRGRGGLDYWEILVLAAVRRGCNLDYDKLQDLAEQHRNLRQIMGLGEWSPTGRFNFRRIRDNVSLLTPETVEKLSHALVAEGHRLAPGAAETARADSFVMETDIHYPSESSLIRDGVRKIIELSVPLATTLEVSGWRQHAHLLKTAKRYARNIDRIASRKGGKYRQRLQQAYGKLLKLSGKILRRAGELCEKAEAAAGTDFALLGKLAELKIYMERTQHVRETARRRVLRGESVPNNEKLFSIFEPHTQLYKRGKAGEPVQFGRLVMIYEDGAGFITHHHLLPREAGDRDVVVEQTRMVQQRLGGCIRCASFDRGFHSPANQQALTEIVDTPCLPKPGAKQALQQEEEATVTFREARQSHPGVESAIGALQSGNGLERCRDRTETGFQRYLALGVLGRNLLTLGKLLIARDDPDCPAAVSRRSQAA